MQSLPAAIWDSTGPHLDDLQAMRLQMDLSRILCKISVLAADHCSDGGLRLRKACSDANQSAYLTVSMMLQRHLDLHTLAWASGPLPPWRALTLRSLPF